MIQLLEKIPVGYIYAFACLLSGVASIFALTRQMQMFQQNSYFPKRYLPWVKENEKVKFIISIIVYAVYSFLNLSESAKVSNVAIIFMVVVPLLIFTLVLIIKSVKLQKKAIIPLKFTARVKRMYSVLIVLTLGFTLLQGTLVGDKGYWCLSVNLFAALFPYVMVLFLWAVLFPFEKIITKRYINDAKRILKSYGGRLKIIGVTGSYGKTGTKMILNAMLKEKYNVLPTPKNFNTTMGVVRTIRECLKPQTEIFICEMGAKKIGDIKEICDLVHPDSALITTVGPQHLDTFGNIKNVFNTKFELYDSVEEKQGATFACGDSEEIKKGVGDKNVILYGTDSSFDYYADNIVCSASGVTFDLHLLDETVQVNTKLLGNHNVLNIVGAAAISHSYGVSANQIKFAVSRLTPPEHRLEIKRYAKGSTLIDDAYNSNPVGCLEACRVLKSFAPMKRVLITPGLVELGEEEYKHNRKLGEVASECADIIILVGLDRSKPIKEGVLAGGFNENNLFVAASFNDAYNKYLSFADENTVVLIENDLPDNYLK